MTIAERGVGSCSRRAGITAPLRRCAICILSIMFAWCGPAFAVESEWRTLSILTPNAYAHPVGWTIDRRGTQYAVPLYEASGKWMRAIALVSDPSQQVKLEFSSDRGSRDVFAKSAPTHCDSQRDYRLCTTYFWVPPGIDHAYAAIRWDGPPGRILHVVVDLADGTSGQPVRKESDRLLKLIRTRYFKSDEVDWTTINTLLDTVPAPPLGVNPAPTLAQLIVAYLPDNKHTFVMAQSAFETTALTPLPTCTRLEAHTWSATLPYLFAVDPDEQRRYIGAFDDCIAKSAHGDLWLIDLRDNRGGFLQPMLSALAPFFASGTLFEHVNPGAAIVEPASITPSGVRIGNSVRTHDRPTAAALADAPVVVAIGRRCASACEAIALAFRDRPRTLLVGEDTAGLVTADAIHHIADDYWLALTERYLADACGTLVGDRVTPRVAVTNVRQRSPLQLIEQAAVVAWRERIARADPSVTNGPASSCER
jgi:hypothetical protein